MNTISKWLNLPIGFNAFPSSLLIMLLLTACGGGDSDTPSTDSNTEDLGSYLFYTSGSVGSGNLFAIDPDIPTSPISVEAGSDIVGCGDDSDLELCSFARGNYDNRTNMVSGYTQDSLVYVKTDGKFYKVSRRKSGDLTPEQVSNETEADQVCREDLYGGIYPAEDFNDSSQSQLVYHLPGADGDCSTNGDNIWKMVRLGMSDTDVPIDALFPLVWLRNLDSDASLRGWLVNDEGSLRRCDEDFLNCSDSLAQIESNARMVFGLGRNNYLLEIDGQIVIYNGDTNSFSNSIFTPPQNEFFSNYVADESYIYIVNSNKFYRAPIDGSSTAVLIAEETPNSSLFIWLFSVMENRLIYAKSAGTGNDAEIKAVDKVGGVPVTLATVDNADMSMFYTRQGLIYYYFYLTDVSSDYRSIDLHAGIMDENGNVQFEVPDAAWVGVTESNTLNLGNNTQEVWSEDKFLLGETNNREISGMSLRVFDGASGNEQINLGTVPNLQGLRDFSCFASFQEDTLCEVSFDRSPSSESPAEPTQQDIFYLNVSSSGSLERVTETTETSEVPVFP